MPAERCRAPPVLSFRARSTIQSDRHKDVDLILKDLKSCLGRLRATMDKISDELRILERLFYKSKNQHRMALFFKRVLEIRRYGQRLVELDMSGRIELLRASFVGLTPLEDSKALRNPWTCFPDQPYVSFVQERLKSCLVLVCKMHQRLPKAYHHFSLAMQSGAFIQLVILFSAICSRMSSLLAELHDVLGQGTSICDRLLVLLDPTHVHVARIEEVHQQSSIGPEMSRAQNTDPDVMVEDLGSSVLRPTSMCRSTDTRQISPLRTNKPSTSLETRITPSLASSNIVAESATVAAVKKLSTKASSIAAPAEESRSRKLKKKRDEMDDIFGF